MVLPGTCGVWTQEFNKMNEYDLSVICLTRKFNFSRTSINHYAFINKYIPYLYTVYECIHTYQYGIVLEIDETF